MRRRFTIPQANAVEALQTYLKHISSRQLVESTDLKIPKRIGLVSTGRTAGSSPPPRRREQASSRPPSATYATSIVRTSGTIGKGRAFPGGGAEKPQQGKEPRRSARSLTGPEQITVSLVTVLFVSLLRIRRIRQPRPSNASTQRRTTTLVTAQQQQASHLHPMKMGSRISQTRRQSKRTKLRPILRLLGNQNQTRVEEEGQMMATRMINHEQIDEYEGSKAGPSSSSS